MFTTSASADYVDIGYNRKLEVSALIRTGSIYYMQAISSENFESVGFGVGHITKSITLAVTVNVESKGKYNLDFQATCYDKGVSAFAGFTQGLNEDKEVGYKIGVGYPINSKASIITHYSKQGVFFGVRRWF